mmetsp:Transcript_69668/g.180726  ORF Transcript_69668/g.180726 Transcript_69668/m.180726 type:complete len:537 (-) Transcript_69668:120-1730(-)
MVDNGRCSPRSTVVASQRLQFVLLSALAIAAVIIAYAAGSQAPALLGGSVGVIACLAARHRKARVRQSRASVCKQPLHQDTHEEAMRRRASLARSSASLAFDRLAGSGSGARQLKIVLGVGLPMYSAGVAFIISPVLIDAKLAADPRLPGLTMETLPITTTALFAGWLVSSAVVGYITDKFGKMKIVFAGALGLLVCTAAAVGIPPLTGGSIVSLTWVRFVTGMLLPSATLAGVLTQASAPPEWRTRIMVTLNIGSSLVSATMALACGFATKSWDWRWELLLWCGLPMAFAAFVGIPCTSDSLNVPGAAEQREEAYKETDDEAPLSDILADAQTSKSGAGGSSALLSAAMISRIGALATCFGACALGFYGLSYSAGELSPDVYTNSALLALIDVFGFIAALSADSLGRRVVQSCAFGAAAACLLLCGFFETGSALLMACALAGRLCLDVCFTMIYVAVTSSFPQSCQTAALGACQLAARLGGVFAPYCGTLPASVSCPAFGALCLAASVLTLATPESAEPNLCATPLGGDRACRAQ